MIGRRHNTRGSNRPPRGSRRLAAAGTAVLAMVCAAAVVWSAPASAKGHSGPAAHAATVQTVKKSMWGGTTMPDGTSAFAVYKDLGVGIYDVPVLWYQVAPTKPANPTDPSDPAYQWPKDLDKTIAEAAANGMAVNIMLQGTPSWANGGKSWQWVPNNTQDFADFCTAISKKYPSVHLWMIWGEPNRKPNFRPMTPAPNTVKGRTGPLNAAEQVAPHNYAKLVDAAYGAFHAANPANKVIGGDTFTTAGPGAIGTYQWIKYMKLPNGKPPRMDMYGHNPYGFRIPSLKDPPSPRGIVAFADLNRLTKALDQAFRPRKLPLYLAEWGVPVGFTDTDLTYSVPTNQAAKWIHAGFKIARADKRIYTLGWVHLLDTNDSSQGLFTQTGVKKTVSYNAYKAS